jgi:hypothetical protein
MYFIRSFFSKAVAFIQIPSKLVLIWLLLFTSDFLILEKFLICDFICAISSQEFIDHQKLLNEEKKLVSLTLSHSTLSKGTTI